MSLNRRAAKRDTAEGPILDALKAAGYLVVQHDKYDLDVWHPRFNRFVMALEVKTPKIGRRTDSQAALVAAGYPLTFVTTPLEALKAVGAVK